MRYDCLIVGTGLYGAVFAQRMREAGRKVLCIDKRDHIGGNIYSKEEHGIQVHKYGAHIFHTSDERVWEYVNRFTKFNNFVNSPIAVYGDEIYNLPFNMNTFSRMWNIKTPAEAEEIIKKQREESGITEPKNLEEQAISLVGRDIYKKLIEGYTEKQWGRKCSELPAFIIKRLPVRLTYNNNYFNDIYQGIPIGGYTAIIERMLGDTPVILGTSYRDFIAENMEKDDPDKFDLVVYTGMIDEYFGYELGNLEYRSLRFEEEYLPDNENFQGNAAVNYTAADVPYTRIIEHKHFEFGKGEGTVITREYPAKWNPGDEPYYPINDEKNSKLYESYRELADKEQNVIFGGRLGAYKYYDMDKVIAAALEMCDKVLA